MLILLQSLCNKLSLGNATIAVFLTSIFESDNENEVLKLILDCTTLPKVIKVTQESSTEVCDELLYLGVTLYIAKDLTRWACLSIVKFIV